jgi:hypothetical protein
MLAQVSKVTNIFFKILHCELVRTDIYHELHKFLKNVHVLLGSSILKTEMKGSKGILPFTFAFVELFSSFPTSFR